MVLSETSRLTSCMLSLVLLPLVIVCFTHPTPVCGIQCYECVHNNQRVRRHDRFVYPCSEFDGSSRYVMDCPDSPYCVYQRITLSLAKDKVHVVTMDGCTPNSTGRGRYAEADLIRPGCLHHHHNSYKPPASLYCYCNDNLCNASSTSLLPTITLILIMITSANYNNILSLLWSNV
ncbi:hypothetical protein Pmani_011661 [Petrolisthes manimaculis]|uniref:Protein quiver n=1 Tax=Petrolisthes manimaculis TaxID=1843537 RepID=A0AAE1Q2I6_9EUCA|nr:hypothetical protein Pmani_011661 [Petrolisthes manimaculis]